ncbi:MAG: WYL domain-containing protein [Deltaproteobacteria bacterium]|nr:WYL domain-containing protein [Deltaproteobacteria bacterium]
MFLAWSGPASRPTMDIDLLGKIDNSIEKIEMVMKQACNMDVEEDGMIFHDHTVSAAGITEDAEYEGTRVRIKGNLGKARVLLQIDIGFGDVVVPGPGRVAYPVLLEFPPPELNGYTMEIPEDFNLEKFTESSFGVYQGEPVYIKIWFHPDVAGTDEIRFWTMTWGSKAVVLEPASLREEILAEAEKMASRYGAPIVGEDNRPYGVTQDRPLQRG